MSDVSGTQRVLTTPVQVTGPSGNAGQVLNPPPQALQLVVGDSLQGTVAGESRGHLLVRTELGLLTLLTGLRLPPGTPVNLQVRQAGTELLLLIFPATGRSDQQAAGRTPTPAIPTATDDPAKPGARPAAGESPPRAGGGPGAPPGAATARDDVLNIGQHLRAVVQAPPVPGGGPPPLAPPALPLRDGGTVILQIVRLVPAAGPPPAPQRPALPTPATTPAPPAGAPSTGPTPAGGAKGRVQEGVVIGRGNQGRPLLQTPVGLLLLEIDGKLPAGTRLLFEIAEARPPADEPPPALRGDRGAGLARGWPALEDALHRLLGAPGGYSPAQPTHAPPQPGPRLASELLFLLAALRAGNVESWLGAPALAALRQQGQEPLASQLSRDFVQLSQLAAERGGEEWRLVPIPLFADGRLQPVRLFLRRHHGAEPGETQDTTRFVVDLELSRLGPLQIDGLVRRARFDIMLRTRDPLPAAMRGDILDIFEAANDAAGYKGRLTFQAAPDWQPMPLPEAGGTRDSLLV